MPRQHPLRHAPCGALLLALVAPGCAGRDAPATPAAAAARGEQTAPPIRPLPPAAVAQREGVAPAAAPEVALEVAPDATPGLDAPVAVNDTAGVPVAPLAAGEVTIEPAARPAAATTGGAAPRARRARLRDLCRQPRGDDRIEESSRRLAETFCGATLWFDGLFGGEPDLHNAQAVSGRVELSTLFTEFDGMDYKGRLRLNYDLPNLERRVRLFLGREDDRQFVTDRQEGFAIRSSVFGLENEEEWLAGLGYRPPAPWLSKFDFRVGGRIKSAPEVFVQARYRHNVFVGQHTVWRFRETLFYENRDGYGSTTSLDWDRVLRPDLLLRWGNVGTYSEATQGLAWRSATLLYFNLRQGRATAGELFVRGETDAAVKLRELGGRLIYRQPLRRPYLYGELITGYTWPRHEPYQRREGSAMIGFGLELLFGRDPW